MISDAIKKMQAMARKAQEETYDGKCTVTELIAFRLRDETIDKENCLFSMILN